MNKRLSAFLEQQAKFWTVRRIGILLTVLYIANLVPLLLIGRYNFAGADDYSIGETCHAAWIATRSIPAVLMEAVKMAAHDYVHWMGYYSAIFMMAVHPGVFGESVYAATPWIMLGALSLGTAYFLKKLLVTTLGMRGDSVRCITALLLLISTQCLIGRNEALYWYCGAVNYTFFYGMGLFYLGLLLSIFKDLKDGRRPYGKSAAASLLGVFTAGGNYMTALTVAILVVLAWALILIRKKAKAYTPLLVPMGLFLAGFFACCLAPGNAVREEGLAGMGAVKSILVSLYYVYDFCVSDWTIWPVLLGLAVMVPFFWKLAGETAFRFPLPGVFAAFAYCLAAANITPPLYAGGNIAAGRLQALIFLQYLLLLTLTLLYITGWARRCAESRRLAKEEDFTRLPAGAVGILVTLKLFILFGSVLSVAADPHFYTVSSAVTDLADGSAAAYGNALQERTKLLLDGTKTELVFEPLPAEPELLFFADITEDPENWENRAVARYYGKKSVVLRGQGQEK